MSRTGSFPLRVALELLQEYADGKPTVFDPFCGKGTSLLAARMLGFPAFGLDVAPEAVVCTAAKLANVNLDSLQDYITSLPVSKVIDHSIPQSVQVFFHPKTLADLLSVRSTLLRDIKNKKETVRQNATVALAALLGILHGHASYSLSISSAHAYSMSPPYVSRYAAKHGLTAPIRDVRCCLIAKITRCLSLELPPSVKSDVKRGSVLTCSTNFPRLVGGVDVILTSPPYLNAQTYAKDNWLRLWLLGYDHKKLRPSYIETGSVKIYLSRMREAMVQMSRMLKPGGLFICIAGDVRRPAAKSTKSPDGIFKTGVLLANLVEDKTIGFRIEKRARHVVAGSSRYLHALSQSNGHSNESCVERVFVARKLRRR